MSNVFYSLFYLVFSVFPRLTSDYIKPRLFTFISDISLNKVYLLNRHKCVIFVGVFQLDIVALVSHGFYAFNSMEFSNTVISLEAVSISIFHVQILQKQTIF